ncbi:hypothetical protein [Streptomyces sp. NPDC057636]|uniref:hypothetical protein n=1 Tax=Streptomyces sp. NPDC057636 TaxID=3346189 RepID=UPI003673F7AF
MSPLARISTSYTLRFAEFAFEPGFTAAVDQHVAELRDKLEAGGGALQPQAPSGMVSVSSGMSGPPLAGARTRCRAGRSSPPQVR